MTGYPVKSCPGDCRIAWTRAFVLMHWKRRSIISVRLRSLTRTKVHNTLVRLLLMCSRPMTFVYRWMAKVPGGTMVSLWRSVKYEEVYLNAYESMDHARRRLNRWIEFYNTQRRHQTLKSTPDHKYGKMKTLKKVA